MYIFVLYQVWTDDLKQKLCSNALLKLSLANTEVVCPYIPLALSFFFLPSREKKWKYWQQFFHIGLCCLFSFQSLGESVTQFQKKDFSLLAKEYLKIIYTIYLYYIFCYNLLIMQVSSFLSVNHCYCQQSSFLSRLSTRELLPVGILNSAFRRRVFAFKRNFQADLPQSCFNNYRLSFGSCALDPAVSSCHQKMIVHLFPVVAIKQACGFEMSKIHMSLLACDFSLVFVSFFRQVVGGFCIVLIQLFKGKFLMRIIAFPRHI